MRLEAQASEPDFWNDQEAAQKVLQQRSRLERVIKRQESFESSVEDAGVLFEFAGEDEESAGELRQLVERLDAEVSQAETEMMLSGESDARTKVERGDVDSVLAGDIDDFIKAYLLSRRAA